MSNLPQFNSGSSDPAPKTLEIALIYAQAGVRVLPLKPRSKVANLNGWPTNATTNLDQITKWFDNTQNNLGLAMGEWAHTATDHTYLVCIDLDTHDTNANGVANWQQLVNEHGEHGEPFMADTATGGQHLVYVSPVPLGNERGALPGGIDVRGVGGYIMAEPSTHPDNGKKPKWRANASWPTAKPGLIPQWVLDIIQTKPEQVQRTAPPEQHLRALNDHTRPGDIYNSTTTWDKELTKHGWQFVETKSDTHGRKDFYARPGKPATKDAHSAVLACNEGQHGVLTVFSTNAPTQLQRADHRTNTGDHYKFTSPFDFNACMNFGGDYNQAAQALGAEQRPQQQREIDRLMGTNKAIKPQLTVVNSDTDTTQTDQPDFGHTYKLRDMSELIGVPHIPRLPDRLMMTTGRGLYYSDADNITSSGSGTMKSWLSAYTCLQQIQQGKHVVVIDYEMQMRDWFTRFQLLGATDTELKLVHYCAPDEHLQYVSMGATIRTDAHKVVSDEVARISELPGGLAWVVIDGITNAMTQNNLKLLDNTDVAKFWDLLPKQIVKLTGAGVGANDHIAKGTNDNPTPIGAQHKIANTSGAAHMLTPNKFLSKQPLTQGVVVFSCIKDRHGEIGQGRKVAQAIFTPQTNGQIHAVVEPYTGEHEQRESNTEQKLLDTIADLNKAGTRASLNKIEQIHPGNKTTIKNKLLNLAGQGKVRNNGTETNMDWHTVNNDIDQVLL